MTFNSGLRIALAGSVVCVLASATLLAQRQLSWDGLDVTARLDEDGVLDIVEQQTMVFSGDWNGGERTFNLRPRQRLVWTTWTSMRSPTLGRSGGAADCHPTRRSPERA